MSASQGQHALPRADTRPTEERAGGPIGPHRVACPFCAREGVVEDTILLCHSCGRWFEVLVDDGEGEES